jgi:hypothetical protein
MRELQQFIVQQNIVDQSEEGDYDVEDARGDENRQEKLQIQNEEDAEQDYGPEDDEE